jgi:membrane protease YdiL (CAAX protease family)
MTSREGRQSAARTRRPWIEALIGYSTFCVLGLLSRLVPVAFVLFVAYGILFPLVWAKYTHTWNALGFSRRNLAAALALGLRAGLTWAAYTYVIFRQDGPLPALWGIQVAIALPLWLLVMSPFQEFFFRGWLQPRPPAVAGRWGGLGLMAVLFTVWHFFPQLEGTTTTSLPLGSPLGLVSIVLAGLLFGAVFHRTGNIAAPWVAHALGGIGLVLIGQMSFIQYVP